MKRSSLGLAAAFACAAAFGLSACEEEGPAEQLGENVDESAESVGEAVEDAGDAAEDAAD
jgi:hypothetical protein